MSVRPLLLGRVFAAGVGLVYASAAAVTVAKIYDGLPDLRTSRWPLFAGQAAILALIAVLTLVGTTFHIADLAVACAAIGTLMIARYDSESSLAPAVGISTGLLAFIYVRGGWGSTRALSLTRRVMLLLAVVLAVTAIWRMEEQMIELEWQRVRTPAGTVQLRTFSSAGDCSGFIAGPKDIDEIDSGCVDVIPAKRAGYVLAFTTASAALAIAGIAGSPRVRRLSDGMTVPTWT